MNYYFYIKYLQTSVRCIAVDLIGMGRSDKSDIGNTFLEHVDYISQFIEKLGLTNVVLVGHPQISWCQANLQNLTTLDIGNGYHHLVEENLHYIDKSEMKAAACSRQPRLVFLVSIPEV